MDWHNRLYKNLHRKVCVIDDRVERVFDGVLNQDYNIFLVKNEDGNILTQFTVDSVKTVRGNLIHVA